MNQWKHMNSNLYQEIYDKNKTIFKNHTLKLRRFPVELPGTKLMFGFLAKVYAMFFAASSFFIYI
jgi:hypothetical protein